MSAGYTNGIVFNGDPWNVLQALGGGLSERQLLVAMEAAEMAVWDWDVNTDRVGWNEQHFQMLGLVERPGEISGRVFFDMVHPDDRASLQNAVTRAIQETGIYQAEFRIIRADDGRVRWMAGCGRMALSAVDGERRMIGVMYDISDRKQLERQKDDLIAVTSHEIRTPVASIKAYAQLLQQCYEDRPDSDEKAMIDRVAYQAERLTKLIGQLLDASKLHSDLLALQRKTFEFDELVQACVADIRQTTESQLILFTPGNCGAVFADRQRIEQVCINLLSNAVKFSPPHSTIHVTTRVTSDEVWFYIKDDGPGVPKDMQAKIFERFFRVGQSNGKPTPGIGLGLYISAEIIYKHNGKIGVISEEGSGARFHFALPRKVD